MAASHLKPQDVVVSLKLAAKQGMRPPIAELARSLHLSSSETHGALKRLASARLYDPNQGIVIRRSLLDLLQAIRFVFPAAPGALTVGLPTAHSAVPLREQIAQAPGDALVWSWGKGEVQGQQVEPLYRSVPDAAADDPELHALLALVDALRVGRARERQLAMTEIERRLVSAA